MRWKKWIPLVVALVFGVIAAVIARGMIASGGGISDASSEEMVSVVVASNDIAPGMELTAELLATSQVPLELAPRRAFRMPSELLGSVSQIEIPKGQQILQTMLAAGGSGTGLQALVPPGMRAIALEVNEFSGVGGMLVPGSRVDVLVTLPSGSNGEPISRTIVQNVKVTAIGQRLTRGEGEGQDFKSVTLVTTPEQAEAIELATTNGRPRLVLRSGRDNAARESSGMTLAELRGSGETVASAPVTIDPIAIAPVEVEPIALAKPIAEVPAVSPVVAATQPVAPPSVDTAIARRAPVQLILGGVESTVMVDDIAAPPREAFTGNLIEP
jgi:pilus assembly protein CpaB